MSRGRYVRLALQSVVSVLAVVLLGVTIQVVRDTPQGAPVPAIGTGAPDPGSPELITCERTLPGAPETKEEIERIGPIGRARSSEVKECPAAFDGQVVEYVGEVIGAVLRRDGGAWALVNDDDYALEVGPLSAGHRNFSGYNTGLSVWLPDPIPTLVPGRSDRRGTIIRTRGVVRRSDPADGGGLTLRALTPTSTTIVAEDRAVDQPLDRAQALLAAVFGVLAGVAFLLERRSRR